MSKLKTVLVSGLFILGGWRLHAAGIAIYPPVQDRGASTATVTTINVTTNVALIFSTGTPSNVFVGSQAANNYSLYYSSSFPNFLMKGRLYLEIYNDSPVDIYCGFDTNVTSIPSINKGRKIAANASTTTATSAGGSWSINGSIENVYCVAPSSTGYHVTVTQAK